MLSVPSDIRGFINWHPVGRVRRADFAANRKVALSICDARLPAWWLTSPKMVNIDEVRKSRPRRSPSFALSSPINSKSMHRPQFLTTSIVLLLASPFAGASETFTQGRQLAPMPKQFKAGDYVWYPQISPAELAWTRPP